MSFAFDWSESVEAVVVATTPEGGAFTATWGYPPDSPCSLNWFAEDGSLVASRTWVDSSVYPWAIASDAHGNALLAGFFFGPVDLGGLVLEPADCADCQGQQVFVVKLDPLGEPLWAKAFSAMGSHGNALATAVAAGPAGEVVVGGRVRGPIDFGTGTLNGEADYDVFVLKLDADGQMVWSQRYGDGDGVDEWYPEAVAVDHAGNVAFGSPGPIGVMDFGSVTLTGDGDPSDGYVAKLDADGEALWATALAGAYVGGVALDSAGNAFAVGGNEGDGLRKLDAATGQFLWHDQSAPGWRVGVDNCDNAVVAAVSLDHIFKRGPDGQQLGDWSPPSPPPGWTGNHDASRIAFDASGSVYFTDHYDSPADFGGGPVSGSVLVRIKQLPGG